MTRTTGSVTPAWDYPGGSSAWRRGQRSKDLPDVWPKVGLYLGIAGAELLCIVFIARLPEVRDLPKDELSTKDEELPMSHTFRSIGFHAQFAWDSNEKGVSL